MLGMQDKNELEDIIFDLSEFIPKICKILL